MADKVDLSLTGQVDPSNKDYYLVKITKLKTDLAYTAKFQWSFQDQTLNDKVQSLWSNGYQFTTIKLPTLLPPKFLNNCIKLILLRLLMRINSILVCNAFCWLNKTS